MASLKNDSFSWVNIDLLPGFASGWALSVGCLVLLGWIFHLQTLASLHPHWVTMKVNTALAFVFLGAALLFSRTKTSRPKAVVVCGLLAVFLGSAAILGFLFHWGPAMDELFVRDYWPNSDQTYPGRMAPMTAFNFVLSGLALLALKTDRKIQLWGAQSALLLTALLSLIAVIGYLYGVRSLYQVSAFTTMAFHTAVTFLIFSLGSLALRPKEGLAEIFLSKGTGARIARRLLPIAIFLPILLGWLRIKGTEWNWFEVDFGTTLLVVLFFLLMGTAIGWQSALLNRESAALSEKTALLDLVLHNMSEGIVVADAQGKMVYYNEGAQRISGIGMSAQKSDKWTEEYGVFNEDQETPCPKEEIPLVKAIHGIEVNHVIQFLRNAAHPEGIFVSVNGRPLRDERGNITGGLVVVRDITREKQAEEEKKKLEATLRTQDFITSVLENLPNMVFVKDAKDLRFVMFNKAGEELLGVPRTDLIGKNDYDFFPKEDADFFTAKDRKTLEARQLLDVPEETLQTREKGPRILHTKKIPVLNQKGAPQYLLGISEDITEQKEQEKMKIYTQALETSNRELQDFVFVASHDLQEPLRKIQAFGEFLRDEFKEVLGETGRDYVERMRNAANRMQILINDLLALTRVTTKAQPFIPVNLSDILQGVLSDLETRIGENKAKVEAGPLPTLEADATQMRQLFQNLIGNALKFQRPGVPPEIKVYASTPPEFGKRGSRCRITVEDNGIGFDNKYGEQIFKVFERLHGRDEYEGTGIGLAVCRKVVERHGGMIKAEGVLGKGSIFTIELPLQHKS